MFNASSIYFTDAEIFLAMAFALGLLASKLPELYRRPGYAVSLALGSFGIVFTVAACYLRWQLESPL